MKKLLLITAVAATAVAATVSCSQKQGSESDPFANAQLAQLIDTPAITAPPAELALDPFYKKYMNVNGIHVCSSWRVPDSCYYAAYITLDAMTRMMPPEVLKVLTDRNTRVAIMARYEGTTDIPEHAYLANDTTLNWDLRARGLGEDSDGSVTSCAEENILAYQIDKYHAEDILVHEFAHTLHLCGIARIDTNINDELQASLDAAVAKGRYRNTYAMTNIEEYFAEGVQNWFNVNAEMNTNDGDGKHNKINTRQEMKEYDPTLYDIIARYFPDTDLHISRHKPADLYHWTPDQEEAE